jgi:cytochrome P450
VVATENGFQISPQAIMWFLLSTLGVALVLVKVYEYISRSRVTSKGGKQLPCVTIAESIRHLAVQSMHQCDFHSKMSNKYNTEPFMYFLAHIPVVVFSNPDHIRTVNLQYKSFEKTTQFLNPHARKMLGENVVFANGEQWSIMRAIIDPAFYNVDRFEKLMERKSQECLEIACQLPQPVNVSELMTALTLDVLGESILGYNFHCLDSLDESNTTTITLRNRELIKQYHYMMKEAANVVRIIGGQVVANLPLESNRKLEQAMEAIDELIQQVIDKCRNEGAHSDSISLLETMITRADENETQFTDAHIKSNVKVLLVAGHDTTQTSLSFATYILAKMPTIQETLREQVQGTDSNYLDCFIKENLRLYTPGPTSILRKAIKSQTIGGYKIEPGQHVECSYYSMHRNPQIWGEDANEFRPERFQNSAHPQHAYSPFGGGSRTCLGKNFSILEQKIFLKEMVSKYQVSLPDSNYVIKYMDQGPLLAIDRNLHVHFERAG